jgi:hypothetical protein
MTLHAGDFADTLVAILEDLDRLKFSQIMQSLQTYEVMGKWLKKDKMTFQGGRAIKRTIADKTLGAARRVGLFDSDEILHGDHLVDLTVPWVHRNTHWSVEYRKDILMDRGKSKVQDVVVPRRIGAIVDMADLLEADGWSAPTGSSDSTATYGLPYYVVGNATTGFNGAGYYDNDAGAAATAVAGITLSPDHTNYQNYTSTYTNMTYDDAVYEMRLAHEEMRFVSPIDHAQIRKDLEGRYRIYCDTVTKLRFEDVARQQNENVGDDVDAKNGKATFRGHPIIKVPYLDSNIIYTGANAAMTTPIYMIDHSSFEPVVLAGDYLREKVTMAPSQSNITVTNVWLTFNFLCTNRRSNGVIYVAA